MLWFSYPDGFGHLGYPPVPTAGDPQRPQTSRPYVKGLWNLDNSPRQEPLWNYAGTTL